MGDEQPPTDIFTNNFIKELLIMERFEQNEKIHSVVSAFLNQIKPQKLSIRLDEDVSHYLNKYRVRRKLD